MNKFDIKDGEYTSTIYGLIKEQRFNDAITILTFIYDTNPSSRAALSLLAYCHYYMQVILVRGYELCVRLCCVRLCEGVSDMFSGRTTCLQQTVTSS